MVIADCLRSPRLGLRFVSFTRAQFSGTRPHLSFSVRWINWFHALSNRMIASLFVAPIEQSHRRALTTANTTQSISVFLSSGLIELNNQIVDSVELDELYLLTHLKTLDSTQERIHLWNYYSARILIVISIFHLLRWMESSKSIVVFLEQVELYLAPSTRAAGSVCGRILSRKIPIWVLTYPTLSIGWEWYSMKYGSEGFFNR